MKSFRQFILTESITKETFDKWKRDALIWANNLDKIKTGDDLIKCINRFSEWLETFEHFLTFELMGKGLKYPSLRFDYLESKNKDKTLKKAIHDFFDNSMMFVAPIQAAWNHPDWQPSALDSKYLHMNDEGYRLYFVGKNYDINWWNTEGIHRWNSWQHKSAAKENFKSTISKLFNNLTRVMNQTDDKKLANKYVTQDYKISDLNVRVSYPENDNHPAKLSDWLNTIRRGIALIKNKKLERAYRALKVRIDIQERDYTIKQPNPYGSELGVGGLYHVNQNLIRIAENSLMNVDVFIHEVGHRYYYEIIGQKAINDWEAYYDKGLISSSTLDTSWWNNLIENAHKLYQEWEAQDPRRKMAGFEHVFWKGMETELIDKVPDFNTLILPKVKDKIDLYGHRWQSVDKFFDAMYNNSVDRQKIEFVLSALDSQMNKWFTDGMFVITNSEKFWKILSDRMKTEIPLLLYKEFAYHLSLNASWEELKKQIDGVSKKTFKLLIGSVTTYGNNSASEFYAESFMYYVMGKPIQENTYRMFKLVSGLI